MNEVEIRELSTGLALWPWIGQEFGSRGLDGTRLLVVGESHNYNGALPVEEQQFTRYAIQRWALDGRPTARAFTITQRAILRGAQLPECAPEVFWNRVAFYNYLQTILPAQRVKPTEEMWGRSAASFECVVEAVRPDCVLLLGKRLWTRVLQQNGHVVERPAQNDAPYEGWFVLTDGTRIPLAAITHPSGRGFRYEEVCPRINRLFRRDPTAMHAATPRSEDTQRGFLYHNARSRYEVDRMV